MATELFVLALLAALFALNVALTVGVVRSDVYTPRQKTMQLALVWLLLVLGPLLVGIVLWSDRAPRGRRGHGVDAAVGDPAWIDSPGPMDVIEGAADVAASFPD